MVENVLLPINEARFKPRRSRGRFLFDPSEIARLRVRSLPSLRKQFVIVSVRAASYF